jgi:tetratricopeptide (TPR) repeat protein
MGPRRGPFFLDAILVVVRGALLACVLVAIAGPARADWQVHRSDSRALLGRAEQALRERPDDDEIARRVLRIAGPTNRSTVLARFRSRAQTATTYAPLAAYARLLSAYGDAAGAAVAFSEALRASPDSVPALIGLARALAATGDRKGALATYERALSKENRPSARRRLLEAQLDVLAGFPDDADPALRERSIQLRRELTALEPDRDGAAERLADALEHAGRSGEAAAVLEARLPARSAEKLRLALRAARLRLADGDPADARRAGDTLLALIDQLPDGDGERRREVWSAAAGAARQQGTLPALAERLQSRLTRSPAAVEWDVLAEVREEMGDLDGALTAARAAEALTPRNVETARRVISLLDRLGRDDEAAAAHAELARRLPSDVRIAVDLVDRQMRIGHRTEAVATLDRAIIRLARDRRALSELAATAARWGDDERALNAWQRLRRLDPLSESAIIGLGEAQFQRGKRDDARRTWMALREREKTPIAGHLRLAEVFLEHDLAADAAAEVRRAQALDPKHVGVHRLLAQIFERQRRFDDAIAEWGQILSLSRPATGVAGTDDDEGASARHEARVRVLGLVARLGRGRLESQVRKLRDELRAHPDDLEAAVFLAEAQQRSGDTTGAIATLRAGLARSNRATSVATEAVFALVHLLKRAGQLDDAMAELDALARFAPGRAREAHLQIADVALARYDADRALSHAAAAAKDADSATLARIADLQARAGAGAAAISTYRQVLTHDDGPAPALALAHLLQREGDEKAAAMLLTKVLRQSRDDDAIAEAGALAVDLGELAGTLPELEREIADALATGQDSAARRRLLVTVLKRILPPLYRDESADETRERLARQALHPLLELVTDPQETPDRATVELVGMLGHGDAAPALAHLLDRPGRTTDARSTTRTTVPSVTVDVQRAAIIALGRLGDPRGRSVLDKLLLGGDVTTRAAALWALGRSDETAVPTLIRAAADRQAPIAVAACLGLGRHPSGAAVETLVATAIDARRAMEVRRAAIFALGKAGTASGTARREAAPALIDLLDSGDLDLARAAALALGWSREPSALPALMARAFLPGQFSSADPHVSVAALSAWKAEASPPDDARLFSGSRVDIDALLIGTAPSRTDLAALARAHTRELTELLSEGLAGSAPERREALDAVDGDGEGLALGALLPDASLSPETMSVAREVILPVADRLMAALDDADPEIQATALRVLAKLGDERVSPSRIAAAAYNGAPALAAAAIFAAERLARDRPGSAASIAGAVAPLLSDERWVCRLTAVEVSSVLGSAGAIALERARADRHPVVRAAALGGLAH